MALPLGILAFLLAIANLALFVSWQYPAVPGFSNHPFDCWDGAINLRANYRLFVPAAYGADNAKRWPIVVFLHGSGGRGNDLNKLGYRGLLKEVRANPDFPFILVAPQCPSNQFWSAEVLNSLLDEVTRNLRVDTNRIYLTGLSMGGYGAWELAIQHPERFAAIVPICGGGDTNEVLRADAQQRQALRRLPVRAYHGAKDQTVKLEESEQMVAALRSIGCTNVSLTIYPEAKHDAWSATYSNPELYEWLAKQHR